MSLKKWNKRLLIVALILSALRPSIALSKEDECTPVVLACDKALADQDRVINLKTRIIESQDQTIKALDTQVTELEKKQGSIFSNPLLYMVVGLVLGGFIVGRVK